MQISGIILLAAWPMGLSARPRSFRLFNFQAWLSPTQPMGHPAHADLYQAHGLYSSFWLEEKMNK